MRIGGPAASRAGEGQQSGGTGRTAKPVVVGVDGSPHSFWAIERALQEASRLGVGVKLVHAVDQGFVVITLIPGDGSDQLRLSAEEVLHDALAVAEGRGVPVEGHLDYGPPGAVLVEASQGASVLVVGSRGRSTCRSASRSSVSTACVRRAACPVVVVPAPDRAEVRPGALTA